MSTSSADVNVMDSELCVACYCCEVACSFHHTRSFWPARSSIQVHRDAKEDKMTITILPSCNLCKGEEEFFCVTACPREGVLSRDLLTSMRRKRLKRVR